MMENVWFDRVSLSIIGLNCVCLAAFDPLDPDCETSRCQVLAVFDKFFSIFFLVEMIIKMVAMGVFGERSYMADPWNKFDFVIVVSGMIDFIPAVDGGGLSALRTFRVVRPLRALNRFPELRILVKLLLDTIPMLASVCLLCFFIFFVFGILAVQLWNGVFHQRCYEPTPAVWLNHTTVTYYETEDGPTDPYICTMEEDGQSGMLGCPPDGSDSNFTVCKRDGPNPVYGAIHFDHIAAAWVVIFQCITLEGWVDIMYMVQGAYSFWAWIYFVGLIVIGAFFAVNLALVVISAQFGATKAAETAAMETSMENEKQAAKDARLENIGMRKHTTWQMIRTCSPERFYYDENAAVIGRELLSLKNTFAELGEKEKQVTRLRIQELEEDLERLDMEVEPDVSTLKGMALCMRHAKLFVTGPIFGNTIMACISLNVLIMAMEHHGQPDLMTTIFEVLNYVFTGIFAVEMVIKLVVLGVPEYVQDGFNVFDGTIVIMSVLEVFLGGSTGLSVLRSFRLVRVFRMARFLPGLQRQLLIMLNTLTEVISFLVILFLFIFIYAILGMQLFGGKFEFDGEVDRKNFDTLIWAITTVFQVLTQEDWNASMHNGVRSLGFAAVLYYITLIVFGNYILFNLFVAILIDGFGGDEEDEEEEEWDDEKPKEEKKPSVGNVLARSAVAQGTLKFAGVDKAVHPLAGKLTGTASSKKTLAPLLTGSMVPTKEHVGTGSGGTVAPGDQYKIPDKELERTEGVKEEPERDLACCFHEPKAPVRAAAMTFVKTKTFDNFIMLCIMLNSVCLAWERPNIKDGSAERLFLLYAGHIFNAIFSIEFIVKLVALGVFYGPNAYFKDSWNRLDGFIVIVSWVDLIMSLAGVEGGDALRLLKIFRMLRALRPLRAVNKLPELKKVVNTLVASIEPIGTTLIIVGVFFFIFSILGVQLMAGKLYYCSATDALSDEDIGANVQTKDDCLRLGGEWVNQKYNFDHMFEALMTLYVLSSIDGWVDIMYSGVDAVGVDKQPQPNYNEPMILYFVIFLLVGGFFILNMFVGVIVENFQRAQSMADAAKEKQLKEQEEAEEAARAASKEELEAIEALRVLNEVKAKMAAAKQSGDEATLRKLEMNLHEAQVNYDREKAEADEALEVAAKEQAEAEEAAQELAYWEAKEGSLAERLCKFEEDNFFEELGPCRRAIYDLVTSDRFEGIIAVFIMANVLTMASEHYSMSYEFKQFLEWTNYIFTFVFLVETVLKMIALNPIRFHLGTQRAWNNFDYFIVVISILGIYFDHAGTTLPVNPTLLRILRILRVARILKLLKSAKDLMVLLATVTNSLRQVGNLALLLFLLFFIFAALGIELFGRMGCTDSNPCDGFSQFANFEDFGMAMLTLFRLTTGDNWNGMMKDGLRTAPESRGNPECSFELDCTDNCCGGCDDSVTCKENCCASQFLTPMYFCSFVLLAQFVMLNLVVAVLMQELANEEGVNDEVQEEEEEAKETPEGWVSEETELAKEGEQQSPADESAGQQKTSPGVEIPDAVQDEKVEPPSIPRQTGQTYTDTSNASSPQGPPPPI